MFGFENTNDQKKKEKKKSNSCLKREKHSITFYPNGSFLSRGIIKVKENFMEFH